MQGFGAVFADELQIGFPHVGADEYDLGNYVFAHSGEESLEGFDLLGTDDHAGECQRMERVLRDERNDDDGTESGDSGAGADVGATEHIVDNGTAGRQRANADLPVTGATDDTDRKSVV